MLQPFATHAHNCQFFLAARDTYSVAFETTRTISAGNLFVRFNELKFQRV
jgi:hypothetical protein